MNANALSIFFASFQLLIDHLSFVFCFLLIYKVFTHSFIQPIFLDHLWCLGPLLGTTSAEENKTKTSAPLEFEF